MESAMQANPHADPFLTTPINPRNYIRAFLGIWAVYGSLLFGMHYFMLDLYVNDFLERNWLAGIESPHKGPISRSEEHTSELQSLMRISYAVFCLKKKQKNQQ